MRSTASRSHPRALSVFSILAVKGWDFLLRLCLHCTIGVAQLALDVDLVVGRGSCDGFGSASDEPLRVKDRHGCEF